MTLQTNTPQRDYVENGVTLVHAIPFQFQVASEIHCSRIVDGVETILTPGVHFNVTGGAGGLGNVTKTSVGTVGATFRIRRVTTRGQLIDYNAHDMFSADAQESALDRLAAVNQEQDVDVANVAAELDTFEASTNTNLANLATLIAEGVPLPTVMGPGYPTRAALAIAGATAANLEVAPLSEAGREGLFVFTTGDISAEVAADPEQAIYVAKSTDPTGATGGWVRIFNGAHNVKWWGAKGDGVTNDSAAVTAALSYLEAVSQGGFGFGNGASELFFPRGHYYFGGTTIEIKVTLILTGESVGEAGGGATALRWDAGTTGIRVQRYNTEGATGTRAVAAAYGGDASIIQRFFLRGGYVATDGEFHGIHLRARAEIRDVYIDNFEGDGIYMKCNAGAVDGTDGNANNWSITQARITNCRKGVFVGVADANAGTGFAIDASGNRQQGIDDQSFLGNVWVMCHTSGNGAEPFRTTNLNAQSVFVGCYAESDQIPASFSSATVIIGGQLASTVAGTGSYIHSNGKGCRIERDLTVKKTFVDDELGNASLILDAFSNTATLTFRKQEDTDTGYIQRVLGAGMNIATYGAGEPIGLRPNNVLTVTADDTGLTLPAGKSIRGSDGAAPAAGTWLRGQIILNAFPSPGGFIGWVCTAAGTPGTWKGFGAIEA